MKLEEKKNIESALSGVSTAILVIGIVGCLFSWSIIKGIYAIISSMKYEEQNVKNNDDWKRVFCILIALDKKEDAKYLLYEKVINSLSFRNIVASKNEDYKKKEIENINVQYAEMLKSIGLEYFDIDFNNSLYRNNIK